MPRRSKKSRIVKEKCKATYKSGFMYINDDVIVDKSGELDLNLVNVNANANKLESECSVENLGDDDVNKLVTDECKLTIDDNLTTDCAEHAELAVENDKLDVDYDTIEYHLNIDKLADDNDTVNKLADYKLDVDYHKLENDYTIGMLTDGDDEQIVGEQDLSDQNEISDDRENDYKGMNIAHPSQSIQIINSVECEQFYFWPLNCEQQTVMCATLCDTTTGNQYATHGEIQYHGLGAPLSDNFSLHHIMAMEIVTSDV